MKKTLIIIIFLLFLIYISLNFFIGKYYFISFKTLLSSETKSTIKKYIKPKLYERENNIKQESVDAISKELNFKKKNSDVLLEKMEDVILSNNKKLIKYKFKNGFYSGIQNNTPGSGYIDFHNGNIIVLSSRGVLVFGKEISQTLKLYQIKNNLNKYIDYNQFVKDKLFSIKDILIKENKIYVSFTKEIKENCWNTSIVYADMNYTNIIFENFFFSEKCILSSNNPEREFNASQSGGRMIKFDENNIFLTIGDYRNRYLGQQDDNINGKIIKINVFTRNYEIISFGHRNPQGLYLDTNRKIILVSEHGPLGGDEINLIDLNEINTKKKLNYGWPIASYGEHYGKDSYIRKSKYKKYPLYKSHAKYGFIEPIKSYAESIGPSEITKINEYQYILGGMKDKSLHFFELNDDNEIEKLEKIELFERPRDLKFYRDKLYIFLEDSPSLGVINF